MNHVLDEKAAAKEIGIAIQTLRNWRHLRKGPAYLKLERSVRYLRSDLETYINKNRIDPENRN